MDFCIYFVIMLKKKEPNNKRDQISLLTVEIALNKSIIMSIINKLLASFYKYCKRRVNSRQSIAKRDGELAMRACRRSLATSAIVCNNNRGT